MSTSPPSPPTRVVSTCQSCSQLQSNLPSTLSRLVSIPMEFSRSFVMTLHLALPFGLKTSHWFLSLAGTIEHKQLCTLNLPFAHFHTVLFLPLHSTLTWNLQISIRVNVCSQPFNPMIKVSGPIQPATLNNT